MVVRKPLRVQKRFFVWGKLDVNYFRIPDKGMCFSYFPRPKEMENAPTFNGRGLTIPGRPLAEINHPNLCFGYNPIANYIIGMVDFVRSNITTSTVKNIYGLYACTFI